MHEHEETRQTGCAHESTDLCLYAERDDLQAGKGRSLQDAEENETLQGNGTALRIGTFLPLRRMGLNSRKARGLLFAARLLQRLNSQEIQGKRLLPPLHLFQP